MLTQNLLMNREAELFESERSTLEQAFSGTRLYAPGQVVVLQGVDVQVSTLLVEGLMSRHVEARDGRRHLVGVHVLGDFVDLHAYALRRLDHDVGALTKCLVAVVPHAELAQIQATLPHLTQRLWFLTMLDAAIHRQWVVRLAALSAIQRVAHFVCEMQARLLAIGQSDGSRFELPMTQSDIGEVCGLMNVHVNRVVRQLRVMELCTLQSDRVEIRDLARLASLGVFQPDYLYLNAQTARRALGA